MNDLSGNATASSTRSASQNVHVSLPDFYTRELQPLRAALEAERNRIGANTKTAAIICVVLGIVASVFIVSSAAPPFVLLFVLFIGASIVGATYSNAAGAYQRVFKMQVIERVVKFFDPNLLYHSLGFVSEAEFCSSQLFSRRPDRYSGEDLVTGKPGATRFRFSHVHAEYETQRTTTNAQGHTTTTTEWHDIFNGLLFIADFNKNFVGSTVVLPDTAQRMFGDFGQTLQSWGSSFSGRELVRLEDPEFERAFAVYSTDQVEARYILSPALMRRLLDLKSDKGCEVYVSFVPPFVYVALPTTKSLFEPPMKGDVLPMEVVEEYIANIGDVVEIITQLDLNTRIWSKD